MKTIIGHDLGSCSGWAVRRADGTVRSGVHLSPTEPHAERIGKYYEWLAQLYDLYQPDVITYEFVQFMHQSTDAARIYYGMMTCVCLLARQRGAILYPVSVSALKQTATGSGAAKKERMEAAAKRQWPDQNIKSHDQADALWLMHCGELLEAGKMIIPLRKSKPRAAGKSSANPKKTDPQKELF
jgi:Holliday junction resolvasome RuvABC endonuclease subunit